MGDGAPHGRRFQCPSHACALNQAGLCRAATGIAPREAFQILESRNGGLEDDACFARPLLVKAYQAPLQRAGVRVSEADALGDLFRLLHRLAEPSERPTSITLGYLLNSAGNAARDAVTHERGRRRCGSCRHYCRTSRRCLRHGLLYGHALSAEADPHALAPRCDDFLNRRGTHAMPEELQDFPPDTARDQLPAALEALARLDPLAWKAVRAAYIDDQPAARIQRELNLTRSQLEALLDRGLRLLSQLLDHPS